MVVVVEADDDVTAWEVVAPHDQHIHDEVKFVGDAWQVTPAPDTNEFDTHSCLRHAGWTPFESVIKR